MQNFLATVSILCCVGCVGMEPEPKPVPVQVDIAPEFLAVATRTIQAIETALGQPVPRLYTTSVANKGEGTFDCGGVQAHGCALLGDQTLIEIRGDMNQISTETVMIHEYLHVLSLDLYPDDYHGHDQPGLYHHREHGTMEYCMTESPTIECQVKRAFYAEEAE